MSIESYRVRAAAKWSNSRQRACWEPTRITSNRQMKNQHVCSGSIKNHFFFNQITKFISIWLSLHDIMWMNFRRGSFFRFAYFSFHLRPGVFDATRWIYIHFYTYICLLDAIHRLRVCNIYEKKNLFLLYMLSITVCASVIAEPNDSHAYTWWVAKAPQRSGARNICEYAEPRLILLHQIIIIFQCVRSGGPQIVPSPTIAIHDPLIYLFLHMPVAGGSTFCVLSCSLCVKFCNCHAMDTRLTRWYDTISDRTKRIRNTDIPTFQFEPTQHIRIANFERWVLRGAVFVPFLSSGRC